MSSSDPTAPKRLALIASKGTLDWAYPPFILASAAASMGWEAAIFFTFYGLTLLQRELTAAVSPLGNPAMPMKLPFGPEAVQHVNLPIPTALMAMPGFNAAATSMMKQTFAKKGVATVGELVTWLLSREDVAALGIEPRLIKASLDARLADHSAPIVGAQVVALFPPMTGG